MLQVVQCKIINIRLRELVFQKCPCNGFVVAVVSNGLSEDTILYCTRCNEIVKEPLMNYAFEMTVLNLFENVVETVSVYDKVAEDFIGCSPKQILRLLKDDKELLNKLEEISCGLYISLHTYPKTERFSTRKAVKIIVNYDHQPKLLDILNRK